MEKSASEPSPLLAKCVAMAFLFSISMFLGSLPMLLAKKFKWGSNLRNSKFAQLLLAFGGGVLLATTFIHLMPEVNENAEEVEMFQNVAYPVAETLTCLGFFIVYFIEECVHLYLHYQKHSPEFDIIRRSVSIFRGETPNPDPQQTDEVMISVLDLENQIRRSKDNHLSPNDLIKIKISTDSNGKSSSHYYREEYKQTGHSHEHGGGDHSHLVGDDKFLGSMRGLMVVLALSIHAIFEGLSIGLEGKVKNVWYMFGAVGAHKFIIAFCIGFELLSNGIKNKLALIYVFTFAVVSPIGILIGIIVSSENSSSDIPSIILQGFASGTLLYVIFFEILKKHEMDGNGLNKFISVFVGFVVMFLVAVLISDDNLDES